MTAERRRSKFRGDGPGRAGPRLLAAVLVSGLLAGCSLGDKARLADRIIGSVDRLETAGPAQGTLAVSLRLVDVPVGATSFAPGGASPPAELPGGAANSFSASIPMTVDVARQRSTLGAADDVQYLFDGLTGYGRRVDAAQGDARPWMKVDLAALEAGNSTVNFTRLPPEAVRNALNPSFVTDLIAGALTGSIEESTGSEVVGGVDTTRYDANFDIEKAVQDTRRDRYPERDRDALYEALDLLGLSGRVFPGTVWLDRDGVPRRFRIELRISPRKGFVFEVGLDLEILSFGGHEVPRPPTDLELLETDSLGAYLQAVTRGRAG